MYRFALTMTPDEVEAVAAQLYVEMLEAGFTRVGEFHYLHHDRDGTPYADIGRDGRAASPRRPPTTGIGADAAAGLLRPCAASAARRPTPGQRRFINDLERFARLLDAAGARSPASPARWSASRRTACAR